MKRLTLALAAALLLAVVAAPRADAATATITARLTNKYIYSGDLTYITGRVTPPRATGRVVVQRLVGNRWEDRQAGTVGADGIYKIGIRPSSTGRYDLRVRSNGGTVKSNTVMLAVFPKPRLLYKVSGEESTTTPYFNTPAEWTLSYSYNCNLTPLGRSNFILHRVSGGYRDYLVNEIDEGGSGVFHMHDGGNFRTYIEVESECFYTVTATAPG